MIKIDTIRHKLREAIKYSGKQQKDIANLIGITPQALAQYISGKTMPTLETFANLCVALDLDANEILCIKN